MKWSFKKLADGRLRVRRSYTHVDEETFEVDTAGHLVTPKCPGCGYSAIQQRCPWERGGDCDRHEVAALFEEALKHDTSTHAFKPYGYRPGECSHCHKPKESHDKVMDSAQNA